MLRSIIVVALLCAVSSCGMSPAFAQEGRASWYGSESGNKTASGERFIPMGMTCAMRTHNWRVVTVTVVSTGKSARCRVNDYGPAAYTGRLIDVSQGVAIVLDFVNAGVVRVRVE